MNWCRVFISIIIHYSSLLHRPLLRFCQQKHAAKLFSWTAVYFIFLFRTAPAAVLAILAGNSDSLLSPGATPRLATELLVTRPTPHWAQTIIAECGKIANIGVRSPHTLNLTYIAK